MKRLIAGAQALRSFIVLARDPRRLDVVFSLRDSLDQMEQVRPIVEKLRRFPGPAAALRERQRLGRIDRARLAALPEGTLGRTYADWMTAMNLDPASIPALPARDELEYLPAHLYETHDIWHVVTGFGPDIAGELGLQAFYLAQVEGPLPLAILSAGMLNSIGNTDDVERRMDEIVRGWQLGRKARPLFGVRWDEMWSRPLAEIRREFGVDASAPAATVAAQVAAAAA